MTQVTEQLRLLKDFLKTDFRKTIRWSAVAMLLLTLSSFVLGLVSSQAVETALGYFDQIAEQSGALDAEGKMLLFPLLANNWRAMITIVLYGLFPFLYLSIFPLALNSAILGVLGGYYQSSGLTLGLYLAGVLPHGIFELPALVLSAACGIYLCRHISFWFIHYEKRIPVPKLLESLLRVMLFLVLPMSAAAAVIEVYVTPAIMGLLM